MSKPAIRAEAHREELLEIWRCASQIRSGKGAPEHLRVASGQAATQCYGRHELRVLVPDDTYGPVAALCLTGFVLYGYRFEYVYERYGIDTNRLKDAYEELEQMFGDVPAIESAMPADVGELGGVSRPQITQRASGLLTVRLPNQPTALPAQPARTMLPPAPSRLAIGGK